MKLKNTVLITLFCSLFVFWNGCKNEEQVVESLKQQTAEPDEFISMSINEVKQFNFRKYDSSWTGTLTVYRMDENGGKIADREFVAAEDSTWQDFGLFVDYLKLYRISPQHELEDWAPDSGTLPARVYDFEVFDGDSTRTYTYQDPVNDLMDYWQSQNVVTFVTFVENELHWLEVENIE